MLTTLLPRSLLVGLLSGLFLTLIEQIDVLPLLHGSEQLLLSTDQGLLGGREHSHHGQGGNPPEDATLRLLGTLISNLVLAFGLALLLQAAMAAHQLYSDKPALTWRSGVLWGLAGFWVFFLAPNLQSPPQAPVHDLSSQISPQQVLADQWVWWLVAISSAWGLVWLYYCRTPLKRIGLMLLVVPHLILSVRATVVGQYRLHPADELLLESLQEQLLFTTGVTNLLFWVLLCGLSAALLKLPCPHSRRG